MDFTAMLAQASLSGNRVAILFRDIASATPLGVPMSDHTAVCEALDWLWHYILTELKDVRLRFLYGDCDPLWFDPQQVKLLLRRVGR